MDNYSSIKGFFQSSINPTKKLSTTTAGCERGKSSMDKAKVIFTFDFTHTFS